MQLIPRAPYYAMLAISSASAEHQALRLASTGGRRARYRLPAIQTRAQDSNIRLLDAENAAPSSTDTPGLVSNGSTARTAICEAAI